MAVTNQELFNIFLANPNMSDAQIVSLMETRGISPAQVSQTFGLPEGQIVSRVAATVPNGQSVTLGDTIIAPQYRVTGSGETQEIGPLEGITTAKTNANNIGDTYKSYTPTGEFQGTGQYKKVDSGKDFLKFALGAGALFGLPSLLNLGAAGAVGAEGLTLSELGLNANNLGAVTNVADVVAGTEAASGLLSGGLTAAELAQLDLATGGVGGTLGATQLANSLTTGATVPTVTSLTGGSGVFTGAAGGITAESVAQKLAADKVIADAELAKKLANTASTITSGLKTVGGLLQTEEDKAAAQLAAKNVTSATQAGVEGAQFRPVGMTTRFGTSNYTYDPITGRMTSAGYQLSPEAKNAQDRLVGLAGRGLTQAEQAQQQFAPLQTGAQNLFGLGNQYISQSPQDVAQNYINQQMQLLQPSREMELANLQNRLQQQGRAGLSVAQGGTLGATTPELQALYNARAQQELQLAANAQQAGQQNVLFGAGLLGQGATAMGNYYGGQQAAYAPYTTALGQVQNLETQAQQPLTMGANLAQQASTAGFNAGRLGLQGASAAADLTTGRAATTNPYASLLSGIDPAFAAGIAKQIWGG